MTPVWTVNRCGATPRESRAGRSSRDNPEFSSQASRKDKSGGTRQWNSITNIGYRPTFGVSDELSIETFLLGALEGPAPERIRLEFLRRVRDERQFATPEALRTQILKDVRSAQNYFRRVAAWTGRTCISC